MTALHSSNSQKSKGDLSKHRFENKSIVIFLLLVYALMLACNLMTDLLVDDYTYYYSLVDGSKIESFFDLFPSIYAHAHKMNGRHVAHFCAQLFLFIPHIIFKLFNPLIFVALIVIIARIADRKLKMLPLLLSFGLIFIFEPVFGQINLWLVGACNYLWAYVICLFWLSLMIKCCTSQNDAESPLALRIAIIPLGLIAGSWSENVSSSTIFMAMLVLIYIYILKRKIRLELILSFAAGVVGFLILAFAPAESVNKISSLSLAMLWSGFKAATQMLLSFAPLILLLAALLTLSLMSSRFSHRNICALILTLGGLASNYILIFSQYYPERSAGYTVVLFSAACAVCAYELKTQGSRKLIACILSLTMAVTAYCVVIAVHDIHMTHEATSANEAYMRACHEQNILDAKIPAVSPKTKYSPAWDLKYIDFEDPDTWPNRNMARYFGLNSVIGIRQ